MRCKFFAVFSALALLSTGALAQSSGSITVFGEDYYSQIANAPSDRSDITQVAAGRRTGYALLQDGTILAWGSDANGECQVPLAGVGHKFVKVCSGPNTGYGFTDDHRLLAWGRNAAGQCDVPALSTGLYYTEVSAGFSHAAAVRSNGTLVCWGAYEPDYTAAQRVTLLTHSTGVVP